MDVDTIFPTLPDGEIVLGKYEYTSCRSVTRTIVYATQFRLLISQKARSCCGCSDRSTYTSIALDSIDQVYEEAARMSTLFIVFNSINLLIWTILLIIGAAVGSDLVSLTITGAVGLALSLLVVIGIFWLRRGLRIFISGTFGNAWLILGKKDARALEALIIENSYQAQSSFWNQSPVKNQHQDHRSAPPPPPPLFGAPSVRFPPLRAAAQGIQKGPAGTLPVVIDSPDFGF